MRFEIYTSGFTGRLPGTNLAGHRMLFAACDPKRNRARMVERHFWALTGARIVQVVEDTNNSLPMIAVSWSERFRRHTGTWTAS
jgi:hypothetical protein